MTLQEKIKEISVPGEKDKVKKIVHTCPGCRKTIRDGEMTATVTMVAINPSKGPIPFPLHLCTDCGCLSAYKDGTPVHFIQEEKPKIIIPK